MFNRALLLLILPLMLIPVGVTAQAIPADQCRPILDHLWEQASVACIGEAVGAVCNGGAQPNVEPIAAGDALTRIGATVAGDQLDALRTPPIQTEGVSAGIAWLRLGDPLNVTGLLIGDTAIKDFSPPDFPAWTAFALLTNTTPPACAAAPLSALVLQARAGSTRLVINGASLTFDGTILVRTDASATQMIALNGRATVVAVGVSTPILSGQMVSVPYTPGALTQPAGAPGVGVPYPAEALAGLPLALFDRPLIPPQPGIVTTQGEINLRVAPDQFSAALTTLGGGETLSVLGQNPSGEWLHVRRLSGETGWVAAALLSRALGTVSAVYEATPYAPQRLGELGMRARIQPERGAVLYTGPDSAFPVIGVVGRGTLVDLLAQSPYRNGWIRVGVEGRAGWVISGALATQAYLEGLPIEWNVPALPTPTPIPGSLGNAFPDPENANENPGD